MAKIVFKGTDRRVLEAADVKVDGFERTEFRRNEAVEVSDEVAKELLSKPRTYGRFITAPAETEETAEVTPEDKADGTSQLGVDSASGSTAADTTLTGSSTRRK